MEDRIRNILMIGLMSCNACIRNTASLEHVRRVQWTLRTREEVSVELVEPNAPNAPNAPAAENVTVEKISKLSKRLNLDNKAPWEVSRAGHEHLLRLELSA